MIHVAECGRSGQNPIIFKNAGKVRPIHFNEMLCRQKLQINITDKSEKLNITITYGIGRTIKQILIPYRHPDDSARR
jgi:hypothetical protein